MRRGVLLAAAVGGALAAGPRQGLAQDPLRLSVGPTYVKPLAALGTYVGGGAGAGGSVHVPVGNRLALTVTADYFGAGPTTQQRRWGGAQSPYSVTIATGTRVFALEAGPAAELTRGPVRAALHVGAGVAHVANSSSVSGLYDLDPFARATTHAQLTWTVAVGGGLGLRVSRGHTPLWLELSTRWIHTGRTGIVREDHLLVGQISGVYLYPTPTDTRFLITRLAIAFGV